MPPIAKTPFSSKNPTSITKSFSNGNPHPQGAAMGEVVCPLFNGDGSQCRKKCVGNFAYRSICEHIRRAHPDNWIPKLPASPETFAKMVGMVPRNGGIGNGMIQHVSVGAAPAMSRKSTGVKQSKSSKPLEDDHFLESPPPSANESENGLPSLLAASISQSFTSRFPPYDYSNERDVDGEHEMDEEMIRGDAQTETEDEDFNNPYGHAHPRYPPFCHIPQLPHHHHLHHHHQPVVVAGGATATSRARASKPKQQKRKRQSTLDSASSTSTFPSRWDELIEAATTRAGVETPLSPPQTAQTLPSICPNTPSAQSEASASSDESGPKVECTECRTLVGIKRAFVCSECVSGFCESCATENGKRGVCCECRVFGARWRRLKVVIRT